jgi:flavin reductase (DIM6/NTAB) family NADH-FMN oxidoreductase RutF
MAIHMTDTRPFRQCLGKFATGVTVVTCTDKEGRPCGITANSFSAVSLEPPLILWNIAKVSNSLDAYLEADHFVVNVLSSRQEAISAHFARSDHTRFDGIEYSMSADGAPVLPDTIATFECQTREVHDCGDHHIIVGEVAAFSSNDGDPLLFFGSGYRRLDT